MYEIMDMELGESREKCRLIMSIHSLSQLLTLTWCSPAFIDNWTPLYSTCPKVTIEKAGKYQLCGLLICTLFYENQGLEKSRSISNPKKPWYFSSLTPGFFFQIYCMYKLSFFSGWRPEKKRSRFAALEIFLRF